MKFIKLNENLLLSKVIVGCMRAMDSGMNREEFLKFTEMCIEMGITSFDHAPVYGNYTCEQLFGDAVLKKKPALRKDIKLVTKAGIVLPDKEKNKTIYYKSTKEGIIREVESSLLKLGTDYIDLLLIHRPDYFVHPEETAAVLELLVRQGKVLHAGVSNFTPSQVEMIRSYLSIPVVTNQIEISVKTVDAFFDGTTDYAFKKRMPLMAWSPLGGGTVFEGKTEQSKRLIETLAEIAKEHQTTVDTIMYAWLFAHPLGIAAITGSMKIDRIKSAIDGVDISLNHDEWYRILAASRGYDVP